MTEKSASQIAWEYVMPLILDFWENDTHKWFKTTGLIIVVGIPCFIIYKVLEYIIFGGIIE